MKKEEEEFRIPSLFSRSVKAPLRDELDPSLPFYFLPYLPEYRSRVQQPSAPGSTPVYGLTRIKFVR